MALYTTSMVLEPNVTIVTAGNGENRDEYPLGEK